MRIVRFVLCVAAMLAVPVSLFAQAGATGSILGTVTDSTGAVIPGANVTVTNAATNVSNKTVSSSSGDYNVPSLIPGLYRVTVEATGFSKSVTTGIVLAVDQKVRVNAVMKAGAVTSTVTVSAQAVTLDTDSEAQSQLLTQRQVTGLPLNGRNFMQLLLLTPGAVTVGGEQGTMRQGEGNAMSVNGGRPEGNNYTLDGLVNTDPALVTPAVIPSIDALQEFQVQSGAYSAEYGYSASQVNLVTRSGGNALHGAFFEFDRNDALDAKPFYTDYDIIQNGGKATTLPTLRQNQFGYVLDGPVYIPKVYNGHDKTFFLANYEGWRIHNGQSIRATIPSPAILAGNFDGEMTNYSDAKGKIIGHGVLPAVGTTQCDNNLSNGLNCMPVDPMTGQPFMGNTIPSAQITSRLAQVVTSSKLAPTFFPTATVSGQPEGVNNFQQNAAYPLVTNQQTYRVDQNLGRLGSVFGRGTYSTFSNSILYNTSSLEYGIETQYEKQKNWEVSHTINIGKSAVNNFRFGYLDAQAPEGAPPPSSNVVSALAETGVFTKFSPLQLTWPTVNLTSFSAFGGPVNAYTGSDAPAWEFADDFSWVHGKHTIGFGFDYRHYHLLRNLDDDFLGDWTFASNSILNNGDNCPNPSVSVTLNGTTQTGPICGTGNAVADMLLGYYSGESNFVPGPLSPSNTAGNPQDHVFNYVGPYFEDDWKPTPKLTVNLGLRWDFRAATYEAKNHFFWLDAQNPYGGLCFADPALKTGGQYAVVSTGTGYNNYPILRYCGSVPRPGQKTPFAPRLGFAYRLNNKTVIRAGAGIFFDSYEGREIDDSADIYPYAIRLALAPSGQPSNPKLTNDLFPASYGQLGPFPVSTLSFVAVIESNNPIDPYVESANLSIERQIAPNTKLELSYVGTHSLHLLDRHDIAQPYQIAAADLPYCQVDPKDATHNCPTFTRLPYQNFSNVYINSDFSGYSHYNAGNVKLDRNTGGLALTAVYTWAKSMDDKSAAAGIGATGSGFQGFMNNHDPSLDYGPSDFNVGQRFVASYVYSLPIGRGKAVLNNPNRGLDEIAGGWQLSGITTFQKGFPYSITASDVNGLNATFFQRANYTPGCDIHAATSGFKRINTACFTQPAAGTFGNTGRNAFTQPGINNWDMGLQKSFQIYERARFDFKFDTFNTFNHHQYNVNVGALAGAGSGGGSAIGNGITSPVFGDIQNSSPARIVQLSGKITF